VWFTANAPKYGFKQPTWALQNGSNPEGWHWQYFGTYTAQPVAQESLENVAVHRPSDAAFYVRAADGSLLTSVRFGRTGDLPVEGHFSNSAYDHLAVYRPSDATFYVRAADGSLLTSVRFGRTGDLPVAGHFE
jgi:hypothetical protein